MSLSVVGAVAGEFICGELSFGLKCSTYYYSRGKVKEFANNNNNANNNYFPYTIQQQGMTTSTTSSLLLPVRVFVRSLSNVMHP